METKVFYGWTGRNVKKIKFKDDAWYGEIFISPVFRSRGKQEFWEKQEWPPIKIKITVEEA